MRNKIKTQPKNEEYAMDILKGVRRKTKFNLTRITDYSSLAQFLIPWSEGRGHHALVILGRPGILKSSIITEVMDGKEHLYLQGFVGPLALYRDLYLHVDEPVVLDDVPITGVLRPVLQPLWDNYDTHTVQWGTAKPPKVYVGGQEDEDIVADDEDNDFEASNGKQEGELIALPSRFQTSSRCCVLTNSIDQLSALNALLDRAYILEFDPPVFDVLERAKKFLDPEVWRWAKRHEKILPNLSVRDLVQAGVDKKIDVPWERILRNRYLDPRTPLGAYLEVISDQSLKTGTDRVRRWQEMVVPSMDRSKYYRVQQEYRKMFPAPNLPRGRSETLRLCKNSQSRKVARKRKKA
jgi:hypothetical protein